MVVNVLAYLDRRERTAFAVIEMFISRLSVVAIIAEEEERQFTEGANAAAEIKLRGKEQSGRLRKEYY